MNERERAPLKREANQGIEAMTEQLKRHKEGRSSKSRFYPEVSNELKAKALDTAITQQQELLARAHVRGRVNLNDLDEVKTATHEYLESCKQAGVIPSFLGLAPALGHSRQMVYRYINTHTTESAEFLDTLRSSFAAIVQQMGMSRTCSEAVSIFVLKNSGQGMADKCELTAVPAVEEKKVSIEELEHWFLDDGDKDQDENTNAWGRVYD